MTAATNPDARADPLVAALQEAVLRSGTRRVPLSVLRTAHARHDPTGSTSSDSRTRLAAALNTLVDLGTVTLPRTSRLYESHLQPALPLWVERPAAPRVAAPELTARVWRPELAAAGAFAVTERNREVLEAVDAFLRDGGSSRPFVPHRERSLELFGYEKRLDALLQSRLFSSGALTLDLLRCYVAPLPLTATHTGDAGPRPALLIVENHATYASVLALARERSAAGAVAVAVGYGAGNQLPAAIAGAAQLAPQPHSIFYFGDLDRDGLAIARAADAAAQSARLPRVRPALPLYEALLRWANRQRSKTGPIPEPEARLLSSWLESASVQAAAVDLLTSGARLAQEAVGYEKLGILPTWI